MERQLEGVTGEAVPRPSFQQIPLEPYVGLSALARPFVDSVYGVGGLVVWTLDLSLETYEVLPDGRSVVYSGEDDRAIDLFKKLLGAIDAIPPGEIRTMQDLRDAAPISFDKAIDCCIRNARRGYSLNGACPVCRREPRSAMSYSPAGTARSRPKTCGSVEEVQQRLCGDHDITPIMPMKVGNSGKRVASCG
jgi:hypothetical protein